jgi:predicted transcriptional regulator
MVIELTPQEEAILVDAARHEGKTVGEFLTETVRWMAQTEQADAASVERGIAQLDRGEFIEHEEMERRVARMLSLR